MSISSPKPFSRRIFSNTTFAILDQMVYKVGTTAAFILLVRLLPEMAIAAVGIGSGYQVLVKYLDIGLTRVLLRDYPSLAKDRERRDIYFTAFLVFQMLQITAMLLLSFAIQGLVLRPMPVPGLSLLFLGMTFDLIALAYQESIKVVFYTDLQQAFATRISVVVTFVRLASYGLLVFSPTLHTFSWLLILTAIASCMIWSFFFVRKFNFQPRFSRRIPGILRFVLGDYGFWNHVSDLVLDTLLVIDTAVLSLFAYFAVIDDYTIALKVTSLLFLIPRQLARSLQVVLANYDNKHQQTSAINTYLKANALLSLGQLAFMLVGGRMLIRVMFGGNIDIEAVYHYTLLTSVGVTIMTLAIPLMGIINNFTSLRKAFMQVFLPGLVAGLALYFAFSAWWGATGIAYAKILVYSLLIVLMMMFVYRNYPFSMRAKLLTDEEKKLLRSFFPHRKVHNEG